MGIIAIHKELRRACYIAQPSGNVSDDCIFSFQRSQVAQLQPSLMYCELFGDFRRIYF